MSRVRTPDNAISYRLQEIQVLSPGKNDSLMQTTEEKLTKNLQHGASKSGHEWIFVKTAQMMQLGVDLHKTCSIVDC